MAARALRSKLLDAASHLFEADPLDLQIERGRVSVAGVPGRTISVADVVTDSLGRAGPSSVGNDGSAAAAGAFAVEQAYDGGRGGWAGGVHCAVVEVDIDTGLVRFERYLVAEDCGEMINPAIVDGQVRGGVAQGIGAVLLERSAYDEQGNFLSATFMDYLVPTAMEIPRIDVFHLETVPLDPDVNFRGVGEGGMIVAPATVCNAIEDALATLGVRVYEQHLPPGRILELTGMIKGG